MKPLLIATVALASAGIGYGVGFKAAERKLSAAFEERLEKETAGMREFYQAVKKPFATPQEAAAELIQETEDVPEESTADKANNRVAYHKIIKKEYAPADDPEEELAIQAEVGVEEIAHHNVFQEAPVIISQEEFMQNDSEYIQGSLTYYQVDEVLTDERESVIEDLDETVGANNVKMFGHKNSGSSDPHIIHIRNGRLQMEFEVSLSESSYRREVLGIDTDPPDLPSGRKRS